MWRRNLKAAGQTLVLCVVATGLAGESSLTQQVTVTGRVTLAGSRQGSERLDDSNAVVWLTPLSPSWERPASRASPRFRMVQKHKRFEPHLLVVPVGAAVEFPNLDPFFHNVFSLFDGKRFDLGLYEAGTTRTVKFDRAGICYIFCDIHPQMSAVVVVLDTPYYAVSDRTGGIRIPNVAPGRYRLQLWHERASPQELESLGREITVQPDWNSLGNIRLLVSGDLLPPHKNKYGRDYDASPPSDTLYEQP